MTNRKKVVAGTAPATATPAAASTAPTATATEQAVSTEVQVGGPGAAAEGERRGEPVVVFAQSGGQIAEALGGVVVDGSAALGAGTVTATTAQGSAQVSGPEAGEDDAEDIAIDRRTILVRSVPAMGRWRIGRHFTQEPTRIAVTDVTDDELERLIADPELILSVED